MSGCIIGLIVGAIVAVIGVGILATFAIFGMRKYLSRAKTSEAKTTLMMIARSAASSYEELQPGGRHRLCPSASQPVPSSASMIRGKKYMSSASDWSHDSSRNAGFACLKVELSMPQYFQYEYEATSTGFVARAHGDLDGDGTLSTFEIRGNVVGGAVSVAPTISETRPEE